MTKSRNYRIADAVIIVLFLLTALAVGFMLGAFYDNSQNEKRIAQKYVPRYVYEEDMQRVMAQRDKQTEDVIYWQTQYANASIG